MVICPYHLQVLTFQVQYFDIVFSTDCISDWLQYHDGSDIITSHFITFCGDSHPKVPTSRSHVAVFRFHTSSFRDKKGFHMKYHAVVRNGEVENHETFGKYAYLDIYKMLISHFQLFDTDMPWMMHY